LLFDGVPVSVIQCAPQRFCAIASTRGSGGLVGFLQHLLAMIAAMVVYGRAMTTENLRKFRRSKRPAVLL